MNGGGGLIKSVESIKATAQITNCSHDCLGYGYNVEISKKQRQVECKIMIIIADIYSPSFMQDLRAFYY